jgi:hypothetical protein
MTFTKKQKKSLKTYILDGLGKELGPMPITEDTLPEVEKAVLRLLKQAQAAGMFKTPRYKVDVRLDPGDETTVHIDIQEGGE